jgi:RNA polymerase sigma-70 factor (sigma-E family)
VGHGQLSSRAPALDIAFEKFASHAAPALLRTAFLLCGDRGTAEDLVQATLLRVFRRWHQVRESPQAYAHKTLVNLSRDRRRGLRRRPPEAQDHERPDEATSDEVEGLLERDAVAAAVRCLPRRQREVLVLRFFLDLSVADTAAALGMREGTVKGYTARALARMRELISPEEPSETKSIEVGDAD